MSDRQVLDNIIKWLDHEIMLSQQAIYEEDTEPVATDGSDDFFKGNLYTSETLLDQIKEWKQEVSK
tara:strand:+ start:376 stop:573 length:198 start_codon:yes stop_codon:yes gene_type:complete